MDYVFTDGTAKQSVERKFVEDLDTSTDVAVYAKLPKRLPHSYPCGQLFSRLGDSVKDGAVKHVYFVAETKGSMSTLDLRGIEDGKIACADRLFEQLSGSGICVGKTQYLNYGATDGMGEVIRNVKCYRLLFHHLRLRSLEGGTGEEEEKIRFIFFWMISLLA